MFLSKGSSMSVVIVRASGGENGPLRAAAIMGAIHALLSEPVTSLPAHRQKSRPEETLQGNPNGLTRKQHVFPSRSIQRFVNQDGRVWLGDLDRGPDRYVKPSDYVFCAGRAWDQRAEAGYMKRIEDEFQKIATSIVDGHAVTIKPEQKPAVDRMFALWYMRARYRELEAQEIQFAGLIGDSLTKEEEENLEKNNYVFTRAGGAMPARQLNGLRLERRINDYARELAAFAKWGVIRTQSGEFIVPDVPLHTIIPLSPRLALVAPAPDGIILEQNVAEINGLTRANAQRYFFARDFSSCPMR